MNQSERHMIDLLKLELTGNISRPSRAILLRLIRRIESGAYLMPKNTGPARPSQF